MPKFHAWLIFTTLLLVDGLILLFKPREERVVIHRESAIVSTAVDNTITIACAGQKPVIVSYNFPISWEWGEGKNGNQWITITTNRAEDIPGDGLGPVAVSTKVYQKYLLDVPSCVVQLGNRPNG